MVMSDMSQYIAMDAMSSMFDEWDDDLDEDENLYDATTPQDAYAKAQTLTDTRARWWRWKRSAGE